MGKLSEIFIGWKNLVLGDPAIKAMAKERETICAQCEHASKKAYLHCALCGCYIPAKSRSPESMCPDGRWPRPVK